MSRSTSSTLRIVSLVACVILSTVMAHAQYRASLQGTVLDPQGAVVPGAKVTLKANDTGLTQEATSDAGGVFTINRLAPGQYTLTVEMKDFRQKVVENVRIVAEQSNSHDVTLEIGQSSESVTVNAGDRPLIDTETGTVSTTITSNEVQNLPSIGRDPFQLLRLSLGVLGQGGTSSLPGSNQPPSSPTAGVFMTENQPAIIANGVRPNANTYSVDGVAVNSLVWGGSTVITPNEESVKEVQVQANQYSAEDGRGAGAQVHVISNTGTNVFHGSLFFKLHRPGLNAYERWGGPFGGTPTRDTGRFNQFGGSVGGPIIKNKLFAFFSYETLRNGTVNFGNGWYVTPEFNAGAVSANANSIAAQWASRPGVNPLIAQVGTATCAQAGLTLETDCAEVAGGLDIGSPLTSGLGNFDPTFASETTPFGIGNGLDGVPDVFFATQTINPTKTNSTQYNGRVDFQATSKDLFAYSMYWVPNDNTSFNGPTRPINLWHSNRLNYSQALLWTRNFSPTMLNEARFNIVRWYYDEQKSNPQMLFGYPVGNISNIGNIGLVGPAFGPPGPGIFYETGYNFRDTLTKVYRSHNLRFGTDNYKDQIQETVTWAGLPPSYQFNNLWDWANDAPLFENGIFDPRTGQPTASKKNTRDNIYAFFAQDDWKVRSNLTFNLGLRWEYFGPLHEKDGNLGVATLGQGSAALTGLTVFDHRDAWKASHNNWGPQIGFAWSPRAIGSHEFNNKLVLRGGFGIDYTRPQPAITLSGRFNVPVTAQFSNLRGSQLLYAPAADPHNALTFPANPATVETFDQTTGLPTCAPVDCAAVNLSAFDRVMKTPRVERYSLLGQYDLGGKWVTTVGFQGSRSHNGFSQIGNLNWLYPNNLNPAVAGVDLYTNNVEAHYNALLTEVQHQFSHNYLVDFQYTFSRCKDHGTQDYYGDPYPFDINKAFGNCENDTSHAFKAYGEWSPRIFRGTNDWREKVLGGWQLSGIYSFHTGFPFGGYIGNVQYNGGCNLIYSGSNFCQATLSGYKGGAGTSSGNDTFKKQYGNFPSLAAADTGTGDNSYFTMPTFSSTGMASAPGIERNPFRGPRFHSFDFTVGKDFGLPSMPVLGENAKLALKFNFYNLFNTLNLNPITGYQSIGNIQVDSTTSQITNFSPNPSFGQSNGALDGRVIEIQARFNF